MAETAKIPKEVVLYIHKKDTAYRCRQCVFAKSGANKCALYGSAVSITPGGTCGLWVQKKSQPELSYIGGVNKSETGYTEEIDGYSCKRCEYFLPEMNCAKVDKSSSGDDPGQILPDGCCNHWSKKDSSNGNTDQ